MRKFEMTLVLAFLLCALPADAAKNKDKKRVERENIELRSKLDSLQRAVDSLKQITTAVPALEDSVLTGSIQAPADSVMLESPVPEMTPDQLDSLMDIWYRTVLYHRDTVEFTPAENVHTELPDSVFIQRLEALNPCISLPFNNTVKNYMVLYSEKMTSAMGAVMGKSQYYFPIFEEVFCRMGLPLELKYLAVVESNLKPTARSKSGAVGLWQLMYRTAKSYGLVIDSYTDERMDVEKSTEAAAKYLLDAYKVFGDWALAICSYNCGAGNVNKAIKRADGKRDFWSIFPYLPKETRGYVPAFVGAMYAMNYAQQYGIPIADVGLPIQVDTFHIERNLHLRQVSDLAGVPMVELRAVNPEYILDIVPGSGRSCVLRIPYSYTSAFMNKHTDKMYAYKASELFASKVNKGKNNIKPAERQRPKTDLSQFSGHVWVTVKPGDSYYSIAREYDGVSAYNIMDYNGVTSTSLKPGMRIKVPIPKSK